MDFVHADLLRTFLSYVVPSTWQTVVVNIGFKSWRETTKLNNWMAMNYSGRSLNAILALNYACSTLCGAAHKRTVSTLRNYRSQILSFWASNMNQLNWVTECYTSISDQQKQGETQFRQFPTAGPVSIGCSYREFFAPLRTFGMETASTWNLDGLVTPQGKDDLVQGSSKKFATSLPITWTSGNICFQQYVRIIAQDHYSLRIIGAGIRIVTHCMADCKVIIYHFPEHNLRHFTFYLQSEQPIKGSNSSPAY